MNDFDGYKTFQLVIPGLVDGAHSTFAQSLCNAVAARIGVSELERRGKTGVGNRRLVFAEAHRCGAFLTESRAARIGVTAFRAGYGYSGSCRIHGLPNSYLVKVHHYRHLISTRPGIKMELKLPEKGGKTARSKRLAVEYVFRSGPSEIGVP